MKVADLGLADSALHAPAAGFGDEDFYPEFVDLAAVLIPRLVGNHPLPEGNKPAGWVALRLFVEINGGRWNPMPSIDEAEAPCWRSPVASAAREATAAWLREHLAPPER